VLFWAVSAGTMATWAKNKQRNYKKEFGVAYPKGRKAIFPGLI
jgi:very-long-chain enoyl-CoA reductase